MIFTNDIIIKGEMAKKFKEFKEKMGFDYIDSYLYSAVLGVTENLAIEELSEKNLNADDVISIPRNVLLSRMDKIDFLSTMLVLIEQGNKSIEELLELAFEENSSEKPKIYRLNRLHQYAEAGFNLLDKELTPDAYDDLLDHLSKFVV